MRFNGLKHGLRAEQVVLPGESREEFEAERQAWFDDWKPVTHTRAVLVERAAVASWRLRRAVRCERARTYDVAADAAHEFDMRRKEVVEVGLHMLPRFPGEAVSRLRSDVAGVDCLIGLWGALAAAVESGWTSRQDHHDRLLNLLGHPAGSDPQGLEIARASLTLLRGNDPDASAAPDPVEVAEAAAALRGLCAERAEEFRRERSQYWDPAEYRRHLIDAAIAPTTKDAQLMHRYEMAHEASLRSALRLLQALEKSGADLPDGPEPAPTAEPEAVVAAQAEPSAPEILAAKPDTSIGCEKLASVGEAAPAPASGSLGSVGSGPLPARGDDPARGPMAPSRAPSGGPGARSSR